VDTDVGRVSPARPSTGNGHAVTIRRMTSRESSHAGENSASGASTRFPEGGQGYWLLVSS
jgi:hypothetical protein